MMIAICKVILSSILLLIFQLEHTHSLSLLSIKNNKSTVGTFIQQCTALTSICGCILTSSTSPTLAETGPESSIKSSTVVVQKIQGSCVSGVGEACESLAQGNALIQQLQRKSALTREQTQKEFLNIYNEKNFKDYFACIGKNLVMKVSAHDGSSSYVLLDDKELSQLKKEGKIQIETVKAMGGRVIDYTSKPRLVWKE